MTDPKGSPGFDPAVVAQFFATLSEFRHSIEAMRLEIKELRGELQELNTRMHKGNETFAVMQLQIKQLAEWQASKIAECRLHQAQTAELREELVKAKAGAAGIGLLWKILISIAAGMSTLVGGFMAIKTLGH